MRCTCGAAGSHSRCIGTSLWTTIDPHPWSTPAGVAGCSTPVTRVSRHCSEALQGLCVHWRVMGAVIAERTGQQRRACATAWRRIPECAALSYSTQRRAGLPGVACPNVPECLRNPCLPQLCRALHHRVLVRLKCACLCVQLHAGATPSQQHVEEIAFRRAPGTDAHDHRRCDRNAIFTMDACSTCYHRAHFGRMCHRDASYRAGADRT